jgi:serine phosphatase RsbU (regulator of sigma subunit)
MIKWITILLFLPLNSLAQVNLDSLWTVWNNESEADTNRLKSIHLYIWHGFIRNQPDSAYKLIQLEQEFAQKQGLKKHVANAIEMKGLTFYFRHQYDTAISHYHQSLKIRDEIVDKSGMAATHNNIAVSYLESDRPHKALEHYHKTLKLRKAQRDIANVILAQYNIARIYQEQGNHAKAISYYTNSLKNCEQLEDKNGVARALNSIAIVHESQGYLDKALEFHQRSLEIRQELNNDAGIASSYGNMGIVYMAKDEFNLALKHLNKALEINESIGDKLGIIKMKYNIGLVYREQGNTEKALDIFLNTLKACEEINDPTGIMYSLNNIGSVYQDQGFHNKAIDILNRVVKLAKEKGSIIALKNAARYMHTSLKKVGQYDLALEMYELYISTRDSIVSEQNQKEIIRQEFKYEYEKQAAADSVVNAEAQKVTDAKLTAEQAEKKQLESESKRQQLENKNQQQQAYFLYGGLALALLFGGFIFNRFRVTQKQKGIIEIQKTEVEHQKEKVDEAYDELEEKNTEILDSITYAKRIQEAILPPARLVKEWLPNSFVLYKPKDIVAGDFYWMESIDNTIIFAAADCTGHGVPGAMVSVVCHNAMNRAVREFGFREPGQILDKTRELVVRTFEKSEEEVKDGMDIALCSLSGNKLQYAGANNPLWIIRNGEVLETKATKQPIGKVDNPQPFQTHTFELQPNDIFYVFSDGYVDQFGGVKGKKFKARAFRELLLSIQSEPMEKQRELIIEAFEKWRGDIEQVDDVCMIGVRI